MKALTVLQPWASLIVHGEKIIETRSWQTKYRGPLLIHAGKRFPHGARELCARQPFADRLRRHGICRSSQLADTLGKIIGSVYLAECVPLDEAMDVTPSEDLPFANFRPGLWSWILTDPTPFAKPIPFRGVLGLFEVNDEMVAANV